MEGVEHVGDGRVGQLWLVEGVAVGPWVTVALSVRAGCLGGARCPGRVRRCAICGTALPPLCCAPVMI